LPALSRDYSAFEAGNIIRVEIIGERRGLRLETYLGAFAGEPILFFRIVAGSKSHDKSGTYNVYEVMQIPVKGLLGPESLRDQSSAGLDPTLIWAERLNPSRPRQALYIGPGLNFFGRLRRTMTAKPGNNLFIGGTRPEHSVDLTGIDPQSSECPAGHILSMHNRGN
jgi:hypothetical protein